MQLGNILEYAPVISGLTAGFLVIYSNKLKKANHVIDKKIISNNAKFDKSKIKINARDKYEPMIDLFVNTLKTKLSFINFPYLKENHSDLIICEIKHNHHYAAYNGVANLINLIPNETCKCLEHDLLHMASSIFDGTYLYSGFRQFNLINKKEIGVGLTEGYTSLLNERYFKKKTLWNTGY